MFSVISAAALTVLMVFFVPEPAPTRNVSPTGEDQQCLAPATYNAESGTVDDPCGG